MKLGAFFSLLVTLALVCSSVVDAKYTTATSANFDSLVTNAKNPVAVVFGAPWSSVSRSTLSYVDEAVGKHPPVTLVFVDHTKTPELFDKYKIAAVPTFKGFYKSKEVNHMIGPQWKKLADYLVGQLAAKSS